MSTIYLAWQDPNQRVWFPVGRLVYDDASSDSYQFTYLKGAEKARQEAGFLQIPGFPDWNRLYTAEMMFPTFRNRVMNAARPDRSEYLHQLGLDVANWNEVTELSITGGLIHADRFEAFPEIVPAEDGRIESRCVLHGLRHTNEDSIRRSELLEIGEDLQLAFELNNPVTGHALSVKTRDQYILGWLPHYLVSPLHQDNAWIVSEAQAKVARVNMNSPLSNRVLVDFSGKLPPACNPMQDLDEYQPIDGYRPYSAGLV